MILLIGLFNFLAFVSVREMTFMTFFNSLLRKKMGFKFTWALFNLMLKEKARLESIYTELMWEIVKGNFELTNYMGMAKEFEKRVNEHLTLAIDKG